MPDSSTASHEPAAKRAARRWPVRALLATVAFLAALVGAGYVFLSGQAGIDLVVRELVARSGGALAIEGATGSLFDTVRVQRVEWRGPDTRVSAHDVALAWSPVALLSHGIVVHGLGAQRLAFESTEAAADVPPPKDLALPIDVRIEHLGIGQLDWRVGTSAGTIRGLAFGYTGGKTGHRIADVKFVADIGAITGDASIGAGTPFPIAGRLKAKGDAALAGADAEVDLAGSLAELTLNASGAARAARFTGRASLAPLAAVPLREATINANGVDLTAWNAALPATALTVTLRARPVDGAVAGTIDATNAAPGTIDAGRVPMSALATRFAWRDDTLTLDAIDVTLAGGGTLAGNGRIPLGTSGSAGAWTLDVRNVDLRQIYAPLIATALSGKLEADLDQKQQRIRGDVADRTLAGGVAFDFSAIATDSAVVVEQMRVRSGKGELEGRGRVALGAERAFSFDAVARRFDPASYGAFPSGTLDGKIEATGTLAPAWRVHADVALARGSRLSGVALSGTARATVSRESIRDAAVDLSVGSGKLAATGATGGTSDPIVVVLVAPKIAEFAPFFPAALAPTLSGTLRAKATFAGLPPKAGVDLEVKAENLKLPGAIAFGTLALKARMAPGSTADFRADLPARMVDVDIAATQFATPAGTFATMHLGVGGTLAQHSLTLAMTNEDLDVAMAAHGGLEMARETGDARVPVWNGSLDALENRGAWALRLAAPATVRLARTRIRVGEARLAVADGSVHLAEFAWDDGRITTSGRFAAVPLATTAKLAGAPLPFGSTVTMGGEWRLAATPHLTGTLTVRREGGDVFVEGRAATEAPVTVGITALEATARFDADAVDATATFRSTQGYAADAKLAIGAVAGAPPGRLAPDAPLAFSATGEIPSLQVLQPWIGSAAVVSGRAHVDVKASGTVSHAALSGALIGEGLRIDAPQYGLHFTNGRVAARAAAGRIVVEEVVLGAGAGEFRASGEVTGLGPGGAKPVARLNWRAEKFRVFNRPDLRLVVAGEGTAVAEGGKISLAGKLRADEGTIVYLASSDSTLGSDVTVKGWSRPDADATRAADVPLIVDLTFDLGNRLTFSGEGIETGLAGMVRVTTGPTGLVGRGAIRTVRGTYFAFGQKLAIDRGQLIFDGRLDNPGLDIVALRRNLAVEAGVTVTGTVKVPVIQLTSNPPVPDSEKLSWLVLGQSLDRSSGADFAALQAASAAILGSHGKPIAASIAQSVGLDDISVGSGSATPASGQSGTPGAENQVISVGKRLTDRLSLIYEQGLTVATNALRLEYELTRSLTLRAEAGTVGSVGLYFRRSFD